jgi:hypothetical protein
MPIVVNQAAAAEAGPIYVELDVAEPADGLSAVYGDVETRESPAAKVIDIARDVYADGLDLARRCAEQAARRLADVGQGVRPDEVELQLAIKLDAAVGAVLVKTSAEAQLLVTFRWKPPTPAPQPGSTP